MMVLVAEEGEVVAPGDRLGSEESCVAGEGTHTFDGYVVASILGKLKFEFPSVSLEQGGRGRPTVSIGLGASGGPKALAIGDEVLCRVRRLNPRYATATIVCKGSAPLTNEFSGLLRVQDVRATEIDKVSGLESHSRLRTLSLSLSFSSTAETERISKPHSSQFSFDTTLRRSVFCGNSIRSNERR